MTQSEIWIGKVQVAAAPESAVWPGNEDAYVNVVTWATDEDNFRLRVEEMFLSYGVRVVEFDRASKYEDVQADVSDEMFEIVLRVQTNQDWTIYGTFHTWDTDTKIV
jgi:hypothetical protein